MGTNMLSFSLNKREQWKTLKRLHQSNRLWQFKHHDRSMSNNSRISLGDNTCYKLFHVEWIEIKWKQRHSRLFCIVWIYFSKGDIIFIWRQWQYKEKFSSRNGTVRYLPSSKQQTTKLATSSWWKWNIVTNEKEKLFRKTWTPNQS